MASLAEAAAPAAAERDSAGEDDDRAAAAPAAFKKKGVFKALRGELQACKKKYGKALRLFWQQPGPPWPARATRTIPRTPLAEAYDVEHIKVRLWFLSPRFEEIPVRVEVDPHKTLPRRLAQTIAGAIQDKWEKGLRAEVDLPEHLRSGSWLVEQIFEWAEKKFHKFLQLEPTLIESYLGFDEAGNTSRRYTLVDKTEQEEELQDADSDDDDEDAAAGEGKAPAEEDPREREIRLRKEKEKQRKRDREFEEKRLEKERKKAEAIRLRELGVEDTRPKQLSKKELAAIAKAKGPGVRTAKTGARAHKYMGPGSKADNEKNKGKKNKKKKKG